MENLNAEQVKKALGCCTRSGCSDNETKDCPLKPYEDCTTRLATNALALINSQEQRIGELEKRLRYLLQSKTIAEYDEVDIHTKEYVKDIHSLDANIKGLTVENEKIGIENFDLICELSRIKEDTVRKMQERFLSLLEKEYKTYTPEGADNFFKNGSYMMWTIAERVFNQIAKEMLEGE